MKLKPEVCRALIMEKRRLRRAKRHQPEHVRSTVWVALKSMTEFMDDPVRPGLDSQVAQNVQHARRAIRER